MAQLLVRNVDEAIVLALRARAKAHGRSVEAEHRTLLGEILISRVQRVEEFLRRSEALRQQIKSPLDSAELVREARDGR